MTLRYVSDLKVIESGAKDYKPNPSPIVSKDQLQFLLSDYTLLSTFCCENDSEVFNDE